MIIRIMKKQVIDTIKANIEEYIINYFKESDNQWLWNVCDCNPFEDYQTIADFELYDYSQQPAIIDFENCKIIYSNLMFLNESQASDERLWAGLAHDYFYNYLRNRFHMNSKTYINQKNPIGNVLTRFFFSKSGRGGYYRNALSKCWWVGHQTFDPINKYKMLDTLGYNNMSTKVTDIFHNYTFSSNPNVLNGIIEGLGFFNKQGINPDMIKDVRPVLQYINAIGGGAILDCYETSEIKNIFIEQLNMRLNGIGSFIESSNEFDDEEDEPIILKEKNLCVEMLDIIECKVITDSAEVITKKFGIKFNEMTQQPFPICELVLGKKIGDIFLYDEINYKITDILRKNE